jgi:Dimethyladenosine transferase (rRNA methylation)
MMPSRFAKPLPPLNAAQILKAHGLRADKSLGQNFLQDPYAIEKIVAAAEIRHTDASSRSAPASAR